MIIVTVVPDFCDMMTVPMLSCRYCLLDARSAANEALSRHQCCVGTTSFVFEQDDRIVLLAPLLTMSVTFLVMGSA
jgi:hypothetical protein